MAGLTPPQDSPLEDTRRSAESEPSPGRDRSKKPLSWIHNHDDRPESSLALDPLSLCALLIFAALVFGTLISSGNIDDGPRLVDDNQIFRLQTEFRNLGFAAAFRDEQNNRLNGYRRFLPFYLAHKVVIAWILGGNLIAWSIYVGLTGTLTAYLLFLFGRQLRFAFAEALLFALLVVYGGQSVVWWRLLHGEGVGMLMLSASLLCMALGIYSRHRRTLYTWLFVVFAVLASLCKESFILVLPALAIWRLWLFHENASIRSPSRDGRPDARHELRKSPKTNAPWLAVLGIACAGELLFIKYFIATATFTYAGWEGFDLDLFLVAAEQFFGAANSWILATALALGPLPWLVLDRPPTRHIVARELAAAAILFALIVFPQLLLYQKTGFVSGSRYTHIHLERYLLPGMLGFSLFTVSALDTGRRQWRIASAEPTRRTFSSWLRVQRWLQPVFAIGLVVAVGARTPAVFARAETYSSHNREVGEWLDSIVRNTAEHDPIVIVHETDLNLKAPLRVKFILEEFFERRNLYFYSLPETPSSYRERIEAFEAAVRAGRLGFFPDLIPHARSMKGVESVADWRDVKVIAIIRSRQPIEDELRERSQPWLDQGRYRRSANALGDVTFYRTAHGP